MSMSERFNSNFIFSNVPELVLLIAQLSTLETRANLARTCSDLFQFLIPLAWETVRGATQLFRLVPGVKIEMHIGPGGTETVYFPARLATTDLRRFNYYASFVKHLYLFKHRDLVYKVHKWDDLLEYANQNVLLPSLLSVTLETLWVNDVAHYPWISLFCSPSVTQVETHIITRCRIPVVSPPTASALFRIFSERCPNLQKLSIFVSPETRPNMNELRVLPHIDDINYPALFFETATRLKSLTITMGVIQNNPGAFLRLSQLPRLEKLTIYSSKSTGVPTPPPLQPDAFPMLRDLSLLDFTPKEALSVWSISPMIRSLVVVLLECGPGQDRSLDLDSFYSNKFIPTLCTYSPNITHLSIRPELTVREDDESWFEISARALKLLQSLPLEALSCYGSCVKEEGGQNPCELLADMFPRLKILRWPDQPATCTDLDFFAKMPLLEHLAIYLELDSYLDAVPLDTRDGSTAPPTTFRILESDFSRASEFNYVDACMFLTTVCSIWPNVHFEQNHPLDVERDETTADVHPRLLNEHFKLIKHGIEGTMTDDDLIPDERIIAFLWGLTPRERQRRVKQHFQ